MARGCHGRFKKAENKKRTGRKQLRTEELGEIWLRRRTPQSVVVPNDDDDDDVALVEIRNFYRILVGKLE